MKYEYLYGVNSVLNALKAKRRTILEAHVAKTLKSTRKEFDEITKLIFENKIKFTTKLNYEMDILANKRPHNVHEF